MATNIFIDLANKFSGYEENQDDDIEAIAAEAGQIFYDALQSYRLNIDYSNDDVFHEIKLDVDPLKNKKDTSKDRVENGLITYWWLVLTWISEKDSDTLLILRADANHSTHGARWWETWSPILHEEISRDENPKEFRRLWLSIAKASIRACLFLAPHLKDKSPLTVDKETQTIIFNGHRIRFPGTKNWQLFELLYMANGKTVPFKDIEAKTDRPDHNVFVGELRAHLKSDGGETIAQAIKNQRSVGYFLDLDSLRQS